MISLQNHLQQLSGNKKENKQNRRIGMQGRPYFFLYNFIYDVRVGKEHDILIVVRYLLLC